MNNGWLGIVLLNECDVLAKGFEVLGLFYSMCLLCFWLILTSGFGCGCIYIFDLFATAHPPVRHLRICTCAFLGFYCMIMALWQDSSVAYRSPWGGR
jgi:hypothetical protein